MIFKPVLIERILSGEKTVTRRPIPAGPPKGSRYESGHTYAIQPGMAKPTVARIEVLRVRRELLVDITSDDARREGFAGGRDDFLAYWRGLYGKVDPELMVWRIEFRLVEVVAAVCPTCNARGVVPL